MPRYPRAAPKKPQPFRFDLSGYPVADDFAVQIAAGIARQGDQEWRDMVELCAFGARGDWKTSTALFGIILHAKEHAARGFATPTRWMAVRDTFTNHRLTTCESMKKDMWCGGWKDYDDEHTWLWIAENTVWAELHLFGLEDQGARERLKQECCGVWFEEAAPSAGGGLNSMGIDSTSWGLAQTSKLRQASHAHPGIITTNMPDDDHWTAQRFWFRPQPRCQGFLFKLPDDVRQQGYGASVQYRDMMAESLADRPDLERKLVGAEFGTTCLGKKVAYNFDYERHVCKMPILPDPTLPLQFGFDFGHAPSIVIGQEQGGEARFYASLYMHPGGMKQCLEQKLMPWLARRASWSRNDPCFGYYGTEGRKGAEDDIDRTAILAIQQYLPNIVLREGPTRWQDRKDTLITALQRHRGLVMNPFYEDEENEGCETLIKAYNGRWYYALTMQGDERSIQPKKPNAPWSDVGDASIYLLSGMGFGTWTSDEISAPDTIVMKRSKLGVR